LRRFNAAIATVSQIDLDRRRADLMDMRAAAQADAKGYESYMRALTPKNDEIDGN